MKLARSLFLAFACASISCVALAQVPGGSGAPFAVTTCGTVGTPYTRGSLTVDQNGNLCSSASLSGGTVTANTAATATAAAPSYSEGSSDALSQTLTGDLRVTAKQSGTWNIGTVTTLPAITGTVTANAGTNLNTSALALDTSVSGLSLGQGSSTSGQKGILGQCAVTTAAPTYTTAQTDPLSCDTSGNLRTSATFSGTVGVTQSTSPWIVAGGGTAGTAATGVVTVQGIASMTKLLVTPDSVALPANQSVNVNQFGGTNVVTGTGASGSGIPRVTVANDSTVILGTGAATIGALTANQSVNVAQIGGTNTVNGGVAGSQSVGGTVATNVAITANPLNLGAQAVSSENAAVTTARQVQLVADLVGRLIVMPFANKENLVKGTTAAMTGTTSTQVIAAVSSQKIYVTHISCVNSSSTGTFVTVQDGSGGTALTTLAAAPSYGGDEQSGASPLFWTTAGNGLYAADVTTGANVICQASGYSGV